MAEPLAILLISFISGVICALGPSGGLILFPFLLALEMPAQVATGTIKLGGLGIWVLSYPQFKKANKVSNEFTKPLTALAILGAIIGANLAVTLNERLFTIVTSIFIIAIVLTSIAKKNLGLERVNKHKKHIYLGFFLYLLSYTLAGFFGPGSGVFIYLIMMTCFGLTMLESHATDIIPWVTLSVLSAVIFAYNGQVDYINAGIIFAGSILGGYIGAKYALHIGDLWVKRLTLWFALACAIGMIIKTLNT